MLVLVATAEAWFWRHDRDFANQGAECWRMSRQAIARAAGSEILGFGTSMSKYGILPRALKAVTGKGAYNLAVFGGPAPASYFLLRRALDAGARPVAVLIDCQDGALDPSRRDERPEALAFHQRCWPELLDLRDAIDLAWTARDATFLGEMVAAWLLPSYRARFEVRTNLMAALEGRPDPAGDTVAGLRRNWTFNRGAQVMGRTIADAPGRRADEAGPDAVRGEDRPARRWPRNRLSLAYARRFVDLAASRGITVFWIMPPASPDVQAERDRFHEGYLTRVARMVQARGRDVVVVDGRHSAYPREVFADAVHLDRAGACRFSADLAAVIRRTLDSPSIRERWVRLPDWRALHQEFPLEEIGESMRAVGRETSRR